MSKLTSYTKEMGFAARELSQARAPTVDARPSSSDCTVSDHFNGAFIYPDVGYPYLREFMAQSLYIAISTKLHLGDVSKHKQSLAYSHANEASRAY
jgi:hypothetical protein